MWIQDFFSKFEGESLAYDDLILLPGFVDFGVSDVDTRTQLTREISLNIPVVSSPMDTVTEADLAIALALQGGLGLIHYNLSPQDQLEQIRKVKRYKNGFVTDPVTLPPQATIGDVVRIREEMGYSVVPITENGESDGRLVGMITKNDYSAFSDEYLKKRVSERMHPLEAMDVIRLDEIMVKGHPCIAKANERLLESHGAAVAIVDKEGHLLYIITRSDLQKHRDFPHASIDARTMSLLVGAAVETWPKKAEERLEVIASHLDVVVFDTSQGYSQFELDLIKNTKTKYPHLQIIAGNVVTEEACEALIKAGADAIRVGMGIGSICTTQEVGGIGRGQASAVYHCATTCRKHGVPLIADGGIGKSSDIVKALSLGASVVMLGSLLACTEEAPGKTEIKNGVKLKEYQGMGSLKAMAKGSGIRYGLQNSGLQVPEGVTGQVAYRGKVSEWVPLLMQGVRQGLNKLGVRGLSEIGQKIKKNRLQIEKRADGAKREGGVHSLYSVVA